MRFVPPVTIRIQGDKLVVSNSDGYCSVVLFEEVGEIRPYR